MAAFWDRTFKESPSDWFRLSDEEKFQDRATAAQVSKASGVYWNQINTGDPWDTVSLGGVTLPGISEVRAQPRRRVQQLKTADVDGETVLIRGYDPAKIDIRNTIWTPEQFEAWQEIMRQLWPRPGDSNASSTASTGILQVGKFTPLPVSGSGFIDASILQATFGKKGKAKESRARGFDLAARAWKIDHPSLDALRIYSVIILSVTNLTPTGPGIYSQDINTVEYFELKPMPVVRSGKVSASKDLHGAVVAERDTSHPEPENGVNQSIQPPSTAATPALASR